MLKGYLNYYAVSGNSPSLWWYFNEVRWHWLKSLKRRSQRAFMSWEKFTSITARFFPSIRILHPLSCHRFAPEPEGRARCVSSARRDPCGGRLATAAPATLKAGAETVEIPQGSILLATGATAPRDAGPQPKASSVTSPVPRKPSPTRHGHFGVQSFP
jgi:hypothetical protein